MSEFKHLPAKFTNPSSPILHESRFKLSNFDNADQKYAQVTKLLDAIIFFQI